MAYAGSPFGSISSVSFWCPIQGVFLEPYAEVSFRGPKKGVLLVGDVGSPSGDRCRMSFRGTMSSNFVKFTWHANPHYRYL